MGRRGAAPAVMTDAFFQTTGHVLTGALAQMPARPTELLALPDGALSVLVGGAPGLGAPQVTLRNRTASALAALRAQGEGTAPVSLEPGDTPVTLAASGGETDVLHLQVLPAGTALAVAVTIIVGLDVTDGHPAVVGQVFTGGI